MGAKALKGKGRHSGRALLKYDETTAEKTVQRGLRYWDMVDGMELQKSPRKGDPRKIAIASLIKRHTSASNVWIAERLGMEYDRSVSRLIKQGKEDEHIQQQCQELEKMLPCAD